jgi:hypothetical protein
LVAESELKPRVTRDHLDKLRHGINPHLDQRLEVAAELLRGALTTLQGSLDRRDGLSASRREVETVLTALGAVCAEAQRR